MGLSAPNWPTLIARACSIIALASGRLPARFSSGTSLIISPATVGLCGPIALLIDGERLAVMILGLAVLATERLDRGPCSQRTREARMFDPDPLLIKVERAPDQGVRLIEPAFPCQGLGEKGRVKCGFRGTRLTRAVDNFQHLSELDLRVGVAAS